jgi:hypothetical protein
MPERSLLFLLLVVFCSPIRAVSFDIYIAPIAVINDASSSTQEQVLPEQDIIKRLESTPIPESVAFKLSSGIDTPPSTFLDAARLCETYEYPYLLYGYLKESEGRYYAEVKLLSREGKNIAASFLSADDSAHYERLISDVCAKIVDYFLVDIALEPVEGRGSVKLNTFEIPFSVGYWTPVGDWLSVAMGMVSAGCGLRFIPKQPLFVLSSRSMYLGLGLQAAYALGKNQSGFETAFLHCIDVRLPIEFFVDLSQHDRVGAALAALVSFDILSQERKYGGLYTETTQAGGASLSLSYRRALSSTFGIGLECRFDALFYSTPLWRITPMVTANFALPGSGGASTEGRHE